MTFIYICMYVWMYTFCCINKYDIRHAHVKITQKIASKLVTTTKCPLKGNHQLHGKNYTTEN